MLVIDPNTPEVLIRVEKKAEFAIPHVPLKQNCGKIKGRG